MTKMRRCCKGFTLIEVIVILAVISILAAMAIPTALRIFQTTATNATTTEMQNLKNAMIGDITKSQNGVRTDFGYLGDVGCLPSSLQDLITKPAAVQSYQPPGAAQIGAGWNGPYITGTATGQATAEFTNDQWGNAYTYSSSGCTAPFTTTFISKGPDGQSGGGDDVDFSIASIDNITTSTVSGFIKDPNGNPVRNSSVQVNYPVNGILTASPTTPTANVDNTGFYSIPNIPFGKKSLSVTPKLIVTAARATTSAYSDGGALGTVCQVQTSRVSSCHFLEFTLVNFTNAQVTVTSVRADYTTTPASFYYHITWGTTNVLDCDSNCTTPAGGTPVPGTATIKTITSSNVLAGSALKPYVFTVDSSQEQLSDIKIGAAGEVGGTVRVRVINFRTCNTRSDCTTNGGAINVNGIPFTITLTDSGGGVHVVQFTPIGFTPP